MKIGNWTVEVIAGKGFIVHNSESDESIHFDQSSNGWFTTEFKGSFKVFAQGDRNTILNPVIIKEKNHGTC